MNASNLGPPLGFLGVLLAAACANAVLVDPITSPEATGTTSGASTGGGGTGGSALVSTAATGGLGGSGGAGGGLACPNGETECDGACVDVTTNALHCGACGNGCPSTAGSSPTCSSGVCGFACHSGKGDCNADPIDGCEAELTSDPLHCGSCMTACPNKQACEAGVCNPKSCLGQLGFKTRTEYPQKVYVWDIATGDLDGDGWLDVTAATAGGGGRSFFNNKNGVFGAPISSGVVGPAEPYDVIVADLDGNGLSDLAYANYDSFNVVVGLRQANGTYASKTYPAGLARSIAAGDFDGDGDLDLGYSNQVYPVSDFMPVRVRFNDGAGGFSAPTSLAFASKSAWAGTYLSVAAGDFNNDGKADLVAHDVSTTSFSVYLDVGGPNASAFVEYPAPSAKNDVAPNSLVTGDFNGDGSLDVVTAGNEAAQLHLGDGKGGFTPAATLADPLTFKMTRGDFDGDARLDLAVARPIFNAGPLSIAVYRGNGDGTFAPMLEVPVMAAGKMGTPSVASGDLDADGKDELLVHSTADANGTMVLTVFPGACL